VATHATGQNNLGRVPYRVRLYEEANTTTKNLLSAPHVCNNQTSPTIEEDRLLEPGTWIQSLRLAQRLTMRDLDERSGVEISTINRVENGKTQPLLLKVIFLCDALGVRRSQISIGRFLEESCCFPQVAKAGFLSCMLLPSIRSNPSLPRTIAHRKQNWNGLRTSSSRCEQPLLLPSLRSSSFSHPFPDSKGADSPNAVVNPFYVSEYAPLTEAGLLWYISTCYRMDPCGRKGALT
jgi:transcriptional regulator with XRE-family HTH domain